ncbi:hypothetical protein [Deinococcus knuensis]|uniref:DUF2946 domain-containing protein n=1 Tax=Deinococcus knuensis TaxID=1837380 RepID=A0ABQ2SGK2_9DEIO|nr:hypothetical protein [Deinococcus knuensis]GGS25692.1 hypothetical protein GCM10008961_16470 [Deinococcus knuensis]
MSRVSSTQQATVTTVTRWVLTLLTLLAAGMHLTRSPEAGGLGLTLGSSAMPGTQVHASAEHVHAAPPQPTHAHMPAGSPHAPAAQAGHGHAHDLTDAAPNAPPQHTHSDRHCPFCLTAGFALAAAADLRVDHPVERAPHVTARTAGPVTFALRHADARAPPAA